MKDFPLARSLPAAAVGTLLLALPMLVLSSSVADGLYLAALILFVMPAALCIGGAVCGLVPLALGCAAALGGMARVFGPKGLLVTAVYLLPVIAAFLVIVTRRVSFWKGCAILIGVHVAALAADYLILQHWAGGDLYASAARLAADALSRWEYGDSVLVQFYSMGLIDLPKELADGVRMEGFQYIVSDAARQDMLLSVSALVSLLLKSIVPGLILIRQSILGGVGCLLLPLRFGFLAEEKRQAKAHPAGEGDATQQDKGEQVDFPDLDMPPFSRWYIPRKYGWQLGAALVLGILLRGSAVPALAVAGLILHYLGEAVFSIQGAAMINYSQHMRGTGRFWRVLVPLLLLSTSLLMVVGLLDQMMNVRGLRKPPEQKEEF